MLDVLYISLNLTSQFSICLYLHILCLFCNQWNGLVPDVLLHIKDNPRSEMHVLRSKRANVPLSGENMCGQPLRPYTRSRQTSKVSEYTSPCRYCIPATMCLQIRIVLLLSYLSQAVISTNVHSSCVSSNPVRMVLRSSNERIGLFSNKIIAFEQLTSSS